MATSSRPRRNVNRRSMEFNEGLLHEEELAIRRALQASLTASKTRTPEAHKNSTPVHHKNNKISKVRRLNNDNNHLPDSKLQNNRKTRLKLLSPDSPHTTAKKRPKMISDDSPSSRSRSSSAQSSDSVNTTSSNSKMVSSASSQTQQKCTKIVKSPLKSPKKEKLGVRVRKKMMKKKFKAAKHGSDCESTMSGSTVNEAVSKKTRTRKRKKNPTFVQKKFASVTPSPSKMSVSTVEIDNTVPLAKAEDFIDFLCLRGHPQLPKDLEFFNNPNNSPLCDDDFPTSPPSSSLSELPSSPSPSLPTVTSVDSPSCETPTFDPLIGCDDELHAMRMYAGVENKRNAVDEQTNFNQEIAVSDLEHEEEPFKNAKPVTPPLSFRVSPRPAPPVPNGKSLSGSKITPSPAPVMTKTSSSTIKTDNVFYPTLDSPAFGPPPLMLGQGKANGPGGCCSPPPLLYIPAAAQRVTHLHGPPKLERVHPISDGTTTAGNEPPLLKRIDQSHPENLNEHSQLNIQNRTSSSLHDGSPMRTSEDQKMNNLKEQLYIDHPLSAVDCTTGTNTNTKTPSMEDVLTQSNIDSYTRNTKSCPLHNASDLSRLEQAKKVRNTSANDPYSSGSPKTRPSSQGANSNLSHVGYNTRSHEACSVLTQSEMNSTLGRIESPDLTISLGNSSLLENLQRAHDRVSGLMSPLETSPPKLQSFTHSGQNTINHESVQMNHSSTLLRENNQIPNSSRLPPPIAEPFTGHTTGNAMPFEPTSREALTPPWSHLHASYDKSSAPPRPYTLSINSSYNPGNHVIPRTIPLVPKLPIVPTNKHISVPFNEKLFLHKPGVNQSYNIPSAFVDSSQKSNVGSLPSYQRGAVNSGYSVNLSEPHSMDKNYYSPQKAKVISSENIPALNSEVCGEDTSNGEELQVIDKPCLGKDSGNNSTNVLTSSQNYSKTNSEVKKRRGRPPGSKNKKTLAQLDKNTKESPSSGDTVLKNESNGTKETENSKSSKKKKIECPILRPTEEEFKDPMIYLKSIQYTLEKFGICIIDPPDGWKMESHLPGNPRFTTKRQLVHRLQKRWGPNEIKLSCIEKHLQQQQSTFNLSQMPVVGGCDLDLAEVSRVVMEHGGMQKVIDTKRWNKVADLLKIPKSTQDRVGKVQDAYCKYLLSFDILPESEKMSLENEVKREIDEKGEREEYRSQCTVKGRSFSMGCFQRTARHFQDHFFKTGPSVNDIEREYWKIVQSRDKYVAAHHVKLDTKEHGSCFPTSKSDPYSKNGWNLNVLAHLKGSILKHAGNVQDLTVPWLNIDMLFSTKRWTTSPLQTYLIDYLHSSNDKVWYGVPESDINKFPHTENENTNDYDDGEFMVSPSNLSRETGLNVTRLEQKQGQFVVVSPKVFHCYVSSGYSVSETVCFAFPDWLSRSSTIDPGIFLNWPGFSYEKLLIKSIGDEVCSTGRKNLECLLSELTRIRDNEVALRKELKELGVTESTPTSTTAKGIQTIETAEGSVQVNSHCMSCVVCDRLCHLSTVLSEEDSEILCLPDAINYIKNEKSSKSFTIVTNCSVSQLDEAISSATKKLKNL